VTEAATASASLGGNLEVGTHVRATALDFDLIPRGPAAPTLTACGALNWRDMAAVLHQGQEADSLSAIERALAHNAVVWLQSVGVEPTTA
jgi:hypothetical protein